MNKPTREEFAFRADWLKKAFGISNQHSQGDSAIGSLEVQRHGWGRLTRNASIENGPMTIGRRTFRRGLAVHAPFRMTVTLPAPGKQFLARIGRDQNPAVANQRTDMTFIVKVNGRKDRRFGPFHGGEEPREIRVPLHGAANFILEVVGSPDFSHADWADARAVLRDGRCVRLDTLPASGLHIGKQSSPPFSFVYGNATSDSFLRGWKRRCTRKTLDKHRTACTLTFDDPKTRLHIRCDAIVYNDFPAVEWMLHFENRGKKDTPLLRQIQALDAAFARAGREEEFTLFHARGSDCAVDDFAPLETPLSPNRQFQLSGTQGRSSTRSLPFMNLQAQESGVILAVGWSGQWAATFRRDEKTSVRVTAGMETTRLRLHPGESIRTPRILMMFWRGERTRAQNLLRRLILKHYTPCPNGKQLLSPISVGNWGMVAEEVHFKKIERLRKYKVPYDYFWIDAGWYGDCVEMSDWVKEAGNWRLNRKLYPNGLRPLRDHLHTLGKKLLLWFDPERSIRGSDLDRAHPGWQIRLGGNDTRLVDFGNPRARRWVTDTISNMIAEEGIDLYRHDSNIDPLPYWRKVDKPDRVGMSEIRHIEGLYAFWDELLRRHPGLIIDNCCSGGRRIDLETTLRSVPLWQSDLQCSPAYDPVGTQAQHLGLSRWIPLHSTGAIKGGDTYDAQSAVASGFVSSHNGVEGKTFPIEWLRDRMREAFDLRPYHYGDFYPLTSHSLAEDVYMAYQLHLPKENRGAVVVYRRERCPYPFADLKLFDLRDNARYKIRSSNGKLRLNPSGKDMRVKGLRVNLPEARSAAFYWYEMV
ncbi:MAG: alpha-galactosidase [Phycisphaerae bacterium]|nr:alpha-galactosidase [Phycisphaerae bacterium]